MGRVKLKSHFPVEDVERLYKAELKAKTQSNCAPRIASKLGVPVFKVRDFITVYNSVHPDLLAAVRKGYDVHVARLEIGARNRGVVKGSEVLKLEEQKKSTLFVSDIQEVFKIYWGLDVSGIVDDSKSLKRLAFRRQETSRLTGYTQNDVRAIIRVVDSKDAEIIKQVNEGKLTLKEALDKAKVIKRELSASEVSVLYTDSKDKIWVAYQELRRKNQCFEQQLSDLIEKHRLEVFSLNNKIAALDTQLKLKA